MAGTVKKLQFSEGTDVGAPTDLSLATSTTTISEYADDTAYTTANGAASAGDVYINSTLKVLRYYTGSAWRNAVPAMDPTNATKTFLIDISGNTTGVSATLSFSATGNRVYSFPDVAITVAGRANAETLSNKTLASPLISGGSIDTTGAGALAIGASVGANNMTLGGATSTVVVAGNLQVDGTTTTVNSTTLEVDDANIDVNKGGNDASAEGAGLTVDRTGTSGSFIYKDASASKFACGPAGSELDVVTVSSTQAVSNKTFTVCDHDGGTASNTSRFTLPKDSLANLTALTRKAGTMVYDTTSSKPYYDDGSALKAIGSGSGGSGGKNYCADFSDGSTVGTVGTGVVTDTGNRASGLTAWQSTNTANISISSSSSSPLRDLSSYLTTGSGNAGAGTTFIESPAWQLDSVDLGKALLVSFDVSDNTTATDWDVCMVRYNSSGTFQEKIAVAGTASTGTPASAVIPTGTTTFRGFFVSSSTQTDYYALRFRRLAGTTNIKLDTLTVGPQSLAVAPPLTGWETSTGFTYSGFGTVSSQTVQIKRVGDTMSVRGNFTSGTAAASQALIILPSGYHINTSAISATTRVPIFGYGAAYSSAGTVNYSGGGNPFLVTYDGTNSDRVALSEFVSSNSLAARNGNNICIDASGDILSFQFEIPIAEWAGSANNSIQGDRAVEEYAYNSSTTDADDTTSFANGPGGGQFGSFTASRVKRVQFQTPILPTDTLVLETTFDGGTTWGAVGQHEEDSACRYQIQNTSTYGMQLVHVSSTQVNVVFGQYRTTSGTTYGSAGSAWSGVGGSASFKWRVRKIAGGAMVGYPVAQSNIVTINSTGEYSANTAAGKMVYTHSGSYNGGGAPTVSGSGISSEYTEFVPRQRADGTWELDFFINGAVSSAQSITITVNGITSIAKAQPIYAVQLSDATTYPLISYVNSSTADVFTKFSTSVTAVSFKGTISLASKPTWAY